MSRMQKTEIDTWQISPQLKTELEEAARARQKSVTELMEEIAREWLERTREYEADDEERQRQIRAAAMKVAGAVERDPGFAQNAQRL